ncbi:MAG: twin-arginine translocase TatA/TatE family subunit [candidate division WOR-3 bacterium]|jgi:TatA/E family protein of Tat protein translocase
MHFGAQELIIILIIILILFGADKLPKLAKSMGDALREFRKASKDDSGNSESKEGGNKKSS